MQAQRAQADWARYTWSLPMIAAPGTRARYCSGTINLVGAVVLAATRQGLVEVLDETLARPLSFARYHANLTPTGEAYRSG